MIEQAEINAHITEFTQKLNELSANHLDIYVYVLRDPRDRKIFYVGRGSGCRVLGHLSEALNSENNTPKHLRIREIWSADEMVDWQIVSRGYRTDTDAEIAEAAVMAALELSQNGALLNTQAGRHGTTRGALSQGELTGLTAQPVNPNQPYETLFVFPVQDRFAAGANPYDATRGDWPVAPHWRGIQLAFAVGLVRGVSIGAYQINSWQPAADRWRFCGTQHPALENLRWTQVIQAARGFYQRGNYLVVELDGRGNFRVKRGSSNDGWQPL